MKGADYAIHLNSIEDILYRIVIPVLKRFVTLTLEDTYIPIVTMISVINGKILSLL